MTITTTGRTDLRPTGDTSVVGPDAQLETLFIGGVLTEGVAAAPDGTIYFSDFTPTHISDMQAGHMYQYDPRTGKTVIFRSPSGMSIGTKFDAAGRMVVAAGADYGLRCIFRSDMQTGKSEILAGLYAGRPLNSPNDLAIDENGRIYFTDPRYMGHEPIDQPFQAVYRIDPDRSVHRVLMDVGVPNGIAVSPDQRTLYVGSNDLGTTDWYRAPEDIPLKRGRMILAAYDLHPDGSAKPRKVLVDYSPNDGPDGMVPDVDGNLYVAVRDVNRPGIRVYSPDGVELAYIPTPDLPTNVAFGRENEAATLYITSGGNLYRIRIKRVGYHLPSID
jgi:gluconolactonase